MLSWKSVLNSVLSLQLALSPALVYGQPSSSAMPAPSAVDAEQVRSDAHLNYWASLDFEYPELTEFALGEPLVDGPLSNLSPGDPLLDQDPFFMQSQSWEKSSFEDCEEDSVCFSKDKDSLVLGGLTGQKSLRLNQVLTPVLETEEWIILTADTDQIFRQKNPKSAEPGEGFFFIRKSEFAANAQSDYPVPVFFFPMPDPGWTGAMPAALELELEQQVVLHDKNGVALPIEKRDITVLENSQRNNLVLAQTWSFLEGKVQPNGVALPKPGSTVAFGLILSGVLPEVSKRAASLIDTKRFEQIVRQLSPLPEAHARELAPSLLKRIRDGVRSRVQNFDTEYWKKWIFPTIAYGGTGLYASHLYSKYPIDWSSMITADMPSRLATIGMLLGGVLASSVLMKYTIHKTKIDKMYPRAENESWLQMVHREHKGILTEISVGLYFSMSAIGQGLRHTLEFFKDHFMPSNHLLHKAWDATMGFQMKQNSRLAINWKTFYLGAIIFGMADTLLVGVDLLIFTPAFIDMFNFQVATGAATAAFVSAELLRNFLGYIQGGAHAYSADMKQIHMLSAEKEAHRILRKSGQNPEAKKNSDKVQELAEQELDKRFRSMGLPSREEFLYDPVSVIEDLGAKTGYSIPEESMKQIISQSGERISKDGLSDDQIKNFKSRFVLSKRRWGLVGPSLDKALKTAREFQAQNNSVVGAQTIKLLEWAVADRSSVKAIAGRTWDTIASQHGWQGLKDSIAAELKDWTGKNKKVLDNNIEDLLGLSYAALKGSLKYLALDSTQKVRDIRQVIYMASTVGTLAPLKDFLPASWIEKAGSEEAALLAAELIHRAFFSYYEEQKDLINPSANLEAKYGAAAEQAVTKLAERFPELNDPFARKVRHAQIVYRLKLKEQRKQAIENFAEKEEKGLAKWQWNAARKAGQQFIDKYASDEINEEWLNIGGLYSKLMDKDSSFDEAEWARPYRYRLAVARAYAKKVGITVNGESSEFVRAVTAKAATDMEGELSSLQEVTYMKKLSPEDRDFYQAKVFSRHFVTNYVGMSVHTDAFLKAASPEFPGRAQAIRRRLVSVPGGKIITKALINPIESLFRNEETSYQPGFWSFIDRNLPVIPDAYHNLLRSSRNLPYSLTLGYLTSYYIWQIHMPYSIWAVFASLGFVGISLIEMNNRLQRLWDSKPMGDVPSKLTYSFIHSRLTNPEIMILQAYAEPIAQTFERNISQPISNAIGSCNDILSGRTRKAVP